MVHACSTVLLGVAIAPWRGLMEFYGPRTNQAVGRSRGGLTSKLHVVVDANVAAAYREGGDQDQVDAA